ncbi:TetR/AcrR family transcriptional regulator [Varunaivibrio sulfuroxidans]|uniref:TetR family transcriptional regulator n=1 Tax=Varunaivibrio sulfuroxidans TaxID=1773489 RepID=A0A4V2UNV6_9PROT|nr:TetR/AcrR family transcriptional regulator [Varunaivibrio sulfuroxidans]TCS63571.1 TetR family transcriptional regulator [Varunaivibrio sulfuroxidans]WES30286.1 helix-turn-helix domain containing protein [Varunaivibrio sulfuroxidans]
MPIQKTDKEEVIAGALELFRRQGYQRTTMADISAACGLLRGSLYHYFPSKEDLAEEAMGHVDTLFKDTIFSIAEDETASPTARLARMGAATEAYFTARRGGCLIGNLALETLDTIPEFRPLIRRYFERWITAYAHIYAAGGMSPRAARAEGRKAVALIQGALMMSRVFEDTSALQDAMMKLSKHPPTPENEVEEARNRDLKQN